MKTVGEIIKTARKSKGLTIKQVASATKIRPAFLTAIEADDFSRFESKTIFRGFIKNYAEYLGLPSESVLAVFKRDFVDKKEVKTFICESGFCWTPKLTVILIITLFALLLAVYLLKQYLSLQTSPY